MRAIKTFILHLYVDPEAPERLCGNLRPLEEPESYPFKNKTQLEELLYRLIRSSTGLPAEKDPAELPDAPAASTPNDPP